MAIAQAAELRGGSHDGFRPEPDAPLPESLFCISTADGEAYARTGEELVDERGRRRAVFAFDPDGALTERARRTFADAR